MTDAEDIAKLVTNYSSLGVSIKRSASCSADLQASIEAYDTAIRLAKESGRGSTLAREEVAPLLENSEHNRGSLLRETNYWTGTALEHRTEYKAEEKTFARLQLLVGNLERGADPSVLLEAYKYYYSDDQRAALLRLGPRCVHVSPRLPVSIDTLDSR